MSIPPSPPDRSSGELPENIYQRVHAARIRDSIPGLSYEDDQLEPDRRAEHQTYLGQGEDPFDNPLLGDNHP